VGDLLDVKCLAHDDVLALLPDRKLNSHKGNYGKLLLLCGSKGYTGAAYLSAMGALRVGAGLVYLGVPESIYAVEAVKLIEPIVFPLADEKGMLSESAFNQISDRLHGIDAVLLGPGLGNSSGVSAIVTAVLSQFSGPVIVDADGINVLKCHKNILRDRTAPTIITPHEGEFQRFTGKCISDRVASAVELAKELDIIVVLKGHNTVITDGNVCYMNKTGNPGMAVGGSGDLLAGMITGLVGQGIAPLDAAASGVWLHGAAGDRCAEELGQYAMLPSDMLGVLSRLMK